ncbi:MAG TPA: DUF29 domain-containing protein [Cyanobacteria bacterium UBA11149]|nr:DUF29 domain-containing protein [Cyanobacteria bacterium UBA11367]HBE57820.1 DUF29 domain-containing protein [Cyanobacteria bacterium UBA11366]HBK66087.1 DUF29 domain-containing protein [Cyanobacteria bacterium UBA11166]HBR73512.1 DUF29 domain-containing protein [Cyanobacteria bacterium UBA11159]HBS68952.1 DUF29 domain-containing protein [Cyanobacteria bacterium UBA11153]HBW91458.1 DUF29 domain-containing protein [Cyanobacteria bacterium UBA11149]HCA96820.1 DUF29 domain-containing protein 
METKKIGQIEEYFCKSLYENDFYAWTQKQAQLLRHGEWSQIDLVNIIEEIESLGKQQRAELKNRLSILIEHLLKWEYQVSKRSRSWLNTMRIQRIDLGELLKENPSLKFYLEEALQIAYTKGVALASGETNLPLQTFPQNCPYTLTEIFRDSFYPGQPAPDDMMK